MPIYIFLPFGILVGGVVVFLLAYAVYSVFQEYRPDGGSLPVSVFHEEIGLLVPASWAGEVLGPPTHRQVFLAGLFSCELTLKYGKVPGKGRALHGPILYIGPS